MNTKFKVGDSVRVKRQFPPGHVRTPYYCRGKAGVVERICGQFANPEILAYGDYQAEEIPLYRVNFSQAELWPDCERSTDSLELELYEHWLEPTTGSYA